MKKIITAVALLMTSFGVAAAPSTMTDAEMGDTVAGTEFLIYKSGAVSMDLPSSIAAEAGMLQAINAPHSGQSPIGEYNPLPCPWPCGGI